MKKRLLFILFASALAVGTDASVAAAAIDSMTFDELKEAYKELEAKYNALLKESEESSVETDSKNTDTKFEYSADGYTYKYLKNQVETIDGTDYVYVFFEYTNDSGQTAMPYYSLTTKAFQNGVEIQSYMSIDDSISEANTTFKDVQTGSTVDIAIKFELVDDSPVSIEMQPMVSWGDVEIGEFSFDLE